MTGNQKIVIAALGGMVGAYIGRRWTWKYSAPIIERVLPGHGKWMQECPMVEALATGAALGALYQVAENCWMEAATEEYLQKCRKQDEEFINKLWSEREAQLNG